MASRGEEEEVGEEDGKGPCKVTHGKARPCRDKPPTPAKTPTEKLVQSL